MSKSTLICSSKTSYNVVHTPLAIPQNQQKNRPKYVSLILTESIASSLNIKTQHLQDCRENASKSKICILVGSSHSEKRNEVAADGTKLPVNDNVALFRVMPMEESSTSVYAMDDLSLISNSNQEKQTDQQSRSFYLGPQYVNTNSLMAVCSLAHDGNLIAEVDKIFVNVRNTDIPLSSSGWVNMCRICHGSDSYEELIGPCRCKGSVALTHLSCLERWLRESSRSNCELCLHHYEILREPKYNIFESILVWMSTPGEHRQTLIQDLIAFGLYTPAAICSTYILMLVGETATRNFDQDYINTGHVIMFFAVAGIAAIDFTYSSWLMFRIQHELQSWKTWYRENCCLTLLLPPRKRRRRCAPVRTPTVPAPVTNPAQDLENSEVD